MSGKSQTASGCSTTPLIRMTKNASRINAQQPPMAPDVECSWPSPAPPNTYFVYPRRSATTKVVSTLLSENRWRQPVAAVQKCDTQRRASAPSYPHD